MPSIDIIFFLPYVLPILIPLIFFTFHRSKLSTTKKKNFPPSPPKLPVIGNIHQLGKLPHQGLRSLSQKYGDIMLLHLGPKPTLVVSTPEAALQVLKTHDLAFCSKPRWSNFTKILYNGKGVVSAPYGDYWRHMRSICVHELLSKTRVQSFRQVREEEVARMVKNIKRTISSSSSSSVVVNMREMFMFLTNDLVCKVTIGMRNKRDDNDNDDDDDDEGFEINVEKLMTEMIGLMARFSVGDFVPWLAWIDRLTGVSARVEKVIKFLDDFLERVLAKHSMDKGKEQGAVKDFVDVLLNLQKGGYGYLESDTDSIKAILLDMFAAGTETSSTTLEWMMSEILTNPNVLEKLQKEVREASKGKELIQEDDLKNMVYLKAVLQETLRLHPPASLLSPRECIQDVQINGYDIEAGTLVFINGWAIGRDPKHWDDPESFRPERFLISSSTRTSSKTRHEFDMIPFGSGRRGCPGESFAIVNMELAMANLFVQFDWRLIYGVEEEKLGMQEHPGITTRRKTPLLATVTARIID